MSLKAVIFDLDGTLLDTAPDFVTTLNQLRAEEKLAPLPEDTIRRTVSNGARALVNMAFGLNPGETEFDRLLQRLLEIYSGILADKTRPFPGIETLLTRLDAHAIAWGIVTNKSHTYTQPILNALQLQPGPTVVVCPDHVTHTKPHPEPLLLACQQLGCEPSEAIYIGDHRRDIECGKNAGVTTIAAAYGYVGEDDMVEEWHADHVVHNAHDIEAIVLDYVNRSVSSL